MNEIEKIGKIMCEEFNSTICGNECECCNKDLAEKLINAGYGDVKQAQREVLEKLKENLFEVDTKEYGRIFVVGEDVIDELIKEVYGE